MAPRPRTTGDLARELGIDPSTVRRNLAARSTRTPGGHLRFPTELVPLPPGRTHVTTGEAARAIGVDSETVRLHCQRGHFPGATQSDTGRWSIPVASVDLWLQIAGPATPLDVVPVSETPARPTGKPLRSSGEVAAALKVTRRTVSRWARAERLVVTRTPGGNYRVDLEATVEGAPGRASAQRTPRTKPSPKVRAPRPVPPNAKRLELAMEFATGTYTVVVHPSDAGPMILAILDAAGAVVTDLAERERTARQSNLRPASFTAQLVREIDRLLWGAKRAKRTARQLASERRQRADAER